MYEPQARAVQSELTTSPVIQQDPATGRPASKTPKICQASPAREWRPGNPEPGASPAHEWRPPATQSLASPPRWGDYPRAWRPLPQWRPCANPSQVCTAQWRPGLRPEPGGPTKLNTSLHRKLKTLD